MVRYAVILPTQFVQYVGGRERGGNYKYRISLSFIPELSVVLLFPHTDLGTKTMDPPPQKKKGGAAFERYSCGITIKKRDNV